jgi:hypothetical protein
MSVEEGTHLAAATGRKIPTFKPDDPQRLAELETREGVREAEHDTMLTERRDSEP